MRGQETVYQSQVDLPISMDHEISKTGHLTKVRAQLRINDTVISKSLKTVSHGIRCPTSRNSSSQVSADRLSGLDGYKKPKHRCILFVPVGHELLNGQICGLL